MQNLPDQPTKTVGNCPDGLFETEAWKQPPKHNLEDAALDFDCGVAENARSPFHAEPGHQHYRAGRAEVDPHVALLNGHDTPRRFSLYLAEILVQELVVFD